MYIVSGSQNVINLRKAEKTFKTVKPTLTAMASYVQTWEHKDTIL